MIPPLAFSFPNLLWPIVAGLEAVLNVLDAHIGNLGWSIIALAVLIRLALWPLNTMQFKGMQKTMALQPQLKEIQAKHKADPQRMQAELQRVYAENGTSPFAGCIPLLVQLPVLFSIYQAVYSHHEQFSRGSWFWIGSPLAAQYPKVLAANLAAPDYVLLGLYVISMYFSVRLSAAPVSDPQQEASQKIMAFVSPLMIAFVGHTWPSAMMLFWLTTNVMQMLQQVLLRRAAAPVALAGGSSTTDATFTVRSAAPARDVESSSRRPRKGPRRSSR